MQENIPDETLAVLALFREIGTRVVIPARLKREEMIASSRNAGASKGLHNGKSDLCSNNNADVPVRSAAGLSPTPLLHGDTCPSSSGCLSE